MSLISPLASIDPTAQIAEGTRIGPFCVIGPDVTIAEGCDLTNNVTVQGICRIGANNTFYPNVVVGVAPQDMKYDGAPTKTEIGYGNVFRENVTIHRGTELGGGVTTIGNENLVMVGAHLAHDCAIGNRTVIGNQVQLAGHVILEDSAVIMAMVGVHHFVTIGRLAYVGGLTPVRRDVPPFMKFSGDPNEVRGVNEEGLKRNGYTPEQIEKLRAAFRLLFKGNAISTGLDHLDDQVNDENVRYLIDFMRRSTGQRFGRYHESERRDQSLPKRPRVPLEARIKDRRKGER